MQYWSVIPYMILHSPPTSTAVPAWTTQPFCPHISISRVFILLTHWRGMEEIAGGARSQIKPHSLPREATGDAPGLSSPDTTSKPEHYSALRAWTLLPAESSSQMKNGSTESSCPHPGSTRRLFLHTNTHSHLRQGKDNREMASAGVHYTCLS